MIWLEVAIVATQTIQRAIVVPLRATARRGGSLGNDVGAVVREVVVVVAVAALSACGAVAGPPADSGPAPPVTRTAGTPAVESGWTSCAVDAPEAFAGPLTEALTLPRLGTGFAATAAVLCRQEPTRRPDGGTDLVLTEGRSTELTGLLAALRLPDGGPTTDACTLELPSVPNLLLFDVSGRWIRPGLPVDGCGKPLPEVQQAVRSLRLSITFRTVVREIESAGAAASGCGQSWSDMVATEAGQQGSRPPVGRIVPPFPPTTPLRLCVFRVPTGQQGGSKPAGSFAYGRSLPPSEREALLPVLAALPPAGRCVGAADRFAVLRASDGTGGELYVELDHCRRVLVSPSVGPPTLAQADEPLLELLAR
ncbi:hypothetical protein [Micromonospora haikouensis]|uniref:Uncharacterized protein n=1 Tax=Micromonospora haikouensis TaxID=686309 RepID=A0A0D0VIP9_9ACTN|nr:hypothetical protein [Micromonospora haikouensis]KIR60643.1 hypothetical protein TK50_22330 [Micromonospora haikouensis]